MVELHEVRCPVTAPLIRLCLCVGLLSDPRLATAASNQANEGVSRPTPSAAEQEKLLAAMRRYAAGYVANLPNFLCVQVTQQYEAGKKPTRWHKGDTLTAKLVFNEGREERTLEEVNDRPVRPGTRRGRTPLTTEGEFGMLLSEVFDETSQTTFLWNGWDVIRGKEVAVFNYAIDRSHSTLSLALSDLARAVVPYHGLVYADPTTAQVWRITNSASDIPPEIQTKSISTTIDYSEIGIAGITYLLPVQATVLLATGSNNIRNEMQFTGYRRFEADSTITYNPSVPDTRAATGKPNSAGH